MAYRDKEDGTIYRLEDDETVTAHLSVTVKTIVSITGVHDLDGETITAEDVAEALADNGIEDVEVVDWEVYETEVE